MYVSDILLTKPGGVTITEAGLLETPLIIMTGLGGQEQDNTDEFVQNQMAFEIKDANEIVNKIGELIQNKNIILLLACIYLDI